MATSPAKENILKRIRQALSHPTPLPFPASEGTQSVFATEADDPAVIFAREFSKLQGRFAYCVNEADLKHQVRALCQQQAWHKIVIREKELQKLFVGMELSDDLASCDASITGCECLVARTGTIVMSAAQESGRTTSVYAPVHICIARASQLVPDLKDAIQYIKTNRGQAWPSQVTFASGPSRTADIEKTLVTGVHGPKEVYCFLVEA